MSSRQSYYVGQDYFTGYFYVDHKSQRSCNSEMEQEMTDKLGLELIKDQLQQRKNNMYLSKELLKKNFGTDQSRDT